MSAGKRPAPADDLGTQAVSDADRLRDTGKKYASSVDVARMAGVSQSAVSRTFSGGANVSESTRRKVLEAAAKLDYRPSLIPRIMLTHKSNLVAIVVGGLYNPFYSAVLEQFTSRFQEAGHQVLLVHAASDHALDDVIPKLASYRVDAIVSALAILSAGAAETLAKLKIPVISFNTAVKNEWVASVSCDNVEAGRAVADLFVDRGARSFAFISGPMESHASAARLRGFQERLREIGAAPAQVGRGDYRYEGGFNAALRLFDGAQPPQALFCANDLLAIGAMDALRKSLGLRIPEDVLVAGFDDIPSASWASIGLTTFRQDAGAMVEETVSIVLASENGKPPAIEPVVVSARLIERNSTHRPTTRAA
ncbi:MAG: LacI family DNA-binding transcriptional regulator [Rhizobiaceae bacterium]|nr:LacI family DNA-binding transcriptional regulator [Rhizobiaceae bacterium]